jgi:hypothetical protein
VSTEIYNIISVVLISIFVWLAARTKGHRSALFGLGEGKWYPAWRVRTGYLLIAALIAYRSFIR